MSRVHTESGADPRDNLYFPYCNKPFLEIQGPCKNAIPKIHSSTKVGTGPCHIMHTHMSKYTPDHMGGPPQPHRKCSSSGRLLVAITANEKASPARRGALIFFQYLIFTVFLCLHCSVYVSLCLRVSCYSRKKTDSDTTKK